jgi:hypothetical protein
MHGGIVICGNIDDRQGNGRRFETMPKMDSGFTIEVDIEDQATGRFEVIMVPESFGGREHNAVIPVLM